MIKEKDWSVELLESESWAADVDRLRETLGAPNNPHLFPPHFLKATFPKIGGQIIEFKREQEILGVGFLFPRNLEAGIRTFTLRFHQAGQGLGIDHEQLVLQTEKLLGKDKVVLYDPLMEQQYSMTVQSAGEIKISRPDKNEASAIRHLQQQIWGQ